MRWPTVTPPSRWRASSAKNRSSPPPIGWSRRPMKRPALVELYGADPDRVDMVPPGVDLDGSPRAAAPRSGARWAAPADHAALRRAHPAAQGAGRAAPGDGRTRPPAPVSPAGYNSSCRRASGSGLADPKWLDHLAVSSTSPIKVQFVEPVARAELASFYRAADLTVVPSYTESFGLVALESQACGTPVVAAAVGGLPTAIADGRSGALVASHDPGEWAQALGRLLSSPAERDRLAVGARPQAELFSWDRTVDGCSATYRTALAAPLLVRRRGLSGTPPRSSRRPARRRDRVPTHEPDSFAVTLPGQARLKTTCLLAIGRRR